MDEVKQDQELDNLEQSTKRLSVNCWFLGYWMLKWSVGVLGFVSYAGFLFWTWGSWTVCLNYEVNGQGFCLGGPEWAAYGMLVSSVIVLVALVVFAANAFLVAERAWHYIKYKAGAPYDSYILWR